MPIIFNQFNTIYVGGRKGRRYEINFCPKDISMPWSVQYRGNGHYYENLRELLAYMNGRGWLTDGTINHYQTKIMEALDRKWDEK